jgi:hypothetical protein
LHTPPSSSFNNCFTSPNTCKTFSTVGFTQLLANFVSVNI